MTSPLVQRLITSIERCKDTEERACYVAELACYWARVGEFEEAERLRTELRRDFGDCRSVRVSVLIMCIEALLMYFRELNPLARNRMAGANVLSTAASDSRLTALTSAWMAHIDFNLNRFETMASAIAVCLSTIDADDVTADCRVSLVLGDAFLFVQALSPSNAWYARARAAASRVGDHAAIGALTYNRAALHLAAARLKSLDQPLPVQDVSLMLAEVQSAINYQTIARLRSLDHLLQTLTVGALLLQERFGEALLKIREVLQLTDVPPHSAQRALLQADLALALASTGQTAMAVQAIESLLDTKIDSFGADDRGVIWSSIHRASLVCGVTDKLPRYISEINAAIAQHNETVAGLAILLLPFEQTPSVH